MIELVIIIIIFVVLLVFPVAFGISVSRRECEPLFVQHVNSRNPRFFAISFEIIFEKAMEDYDGSGTIMLTQEEGIIEADKTEIPANYICDKAVFADKIDFEPNEGIVFENEIYSKTFANLHKVTQVSAIKCNEELIIGKNTLIKKWADSDDTLYVNDGCNLGKSASSGTRMIIGRDCSFKRLYAPEVFIGYDIKEGNENECILQDVAIEIRETIYDEFIRNIEQTYKNLVKNTIITKYDLEIIHQTEVQGHVRSHESIVIGENCIIHGNVFAEDDIIIKSNTIILGVVFSQEDIEIHDNVIIGQPGKIKSIVARGNISFGKNCKVLGSVTANKNGRICKDSSELLTNVG